MLDKRIIDPGIAGDRDSSTDVQYTHLRNYLKNTLPFKLLLDGNII